MVKGKSKMTELVSWLICFFFSKRYTRCGHCGGGGIILIDQAWTGGCPVCDGMGYLAK
jgi:hypothetical protein